MEILEAGLIKISNQKPLINNERLTKAISNPVRILFTTLLLTTCASHVIRAQHSSPDTINATFTTSKIVFDGNYAFNTKLNVTYFVQWNSVSDYLAGNFRLQWIPKIGTDFFLVFNQSYDQLNNLDIRSPKTNTGVAKLVWRFVF